MSRKQRITTKLWLLLVAVPSKSLGRGQPQKELANTRQCLIKKALLGAVMGGWGVPVTATEEADLDGLPDPCLS